MLASSHLTPSVVPALEERTSQPSNSLASVSQDNKTERARAHQPNRATSNGAAKDVRGVSFDDDVRHVAKQSLAMEGTIQSPPTPPLLTDPSLSLGGEMLDLFMPAPDGTSEPVLDSPSIASLCSSLMPSVELVPKDFYGNERSKVADDEKRRRTYSARGDPFGRSLPTHSEMARRLAR